MTKTIRIRKVPNSHLYSWAGYGFNSCVVSILSDKKLNGVTKLKAELKHIAKDIKPKLSKDELEEVFQSIRRMDVGGATKEDLDIIKKFASHFDTRVIFE